MYDFADEEDCEEEEEECTEFDSDNIDEKEYLDDEFSYDDGDDNDDDHSLFSPLSLLLLFLSCLFLRLNFFGSWLASTIFWRSWRPLRFPLNVDAVSRLPLLNALSS